MFRIKNFMYIFKKLNLMLIFRVLPDMIGGNGYNGTIPDAELLVRWAQANTFMPAMQFSYLPWEITNDTVRFLFHSLIHLVSSLQSAVCNIHSRDI